LRLFGCLTLACLIFIAAPVARGQGIRAPDLLTDVATSELGPAGTQVLLTFAPAAPTFSIIANDTTHPIIGFALSSRGNSATVRPSEHGLLRMVDFQQNETVLVLRLSAATPVHLSAAPLGDKQVALTLAPLARTQFAVADGSAGGFPRAADRPEDEDGFVLVPLKYADVSEVVGLLTDGLSVRPNDYFTPHEPAFGSAGMNGGPAIAAPPAANPQDLDQSVGQSVNDAIGVDRRLNAVILKGSPERIARLRAKIAEIDVPVQSVILETVFVELTDTGAKNVGLDYNNANGQLGVATYQVGAYIPPGFNTDKPLTSAALQAAIYAQVQQGRGRIVSKPRIAAQSGGAAKIVTGDALPILTAITLSGVNGVSQQVQYVNVGVTLQIAPRVSSDGFVTSHVFCVVSSVTGYSQGYPTISQREAETSATVHDGETFVIGGLTEENEISTKGKVPGFGDVPLAGELFKLHKSTKSKTELYIVVTPHVVRASDAQAAAAMLDASRLR
jgi:general secretion pathway protein D